MNALVDLKKEEFNILFIGNSYTFFNKSWDIVKKIGEMQNIKINVFEVTSGGYTLKQMADNNDAFGKKVHDYLNNQSFDVVLLQEQSIRPCIDKNLFFEAVRYLHKLINKNGAKTLLYETWGRKEGCIDLLNLNMTNQSMSESLSKSYESIGKELNIPISPVGKAFYLVNSQYKDIINLYDEDGSHPSVVGSYFLSLIHFCKIFNINPKDVKYKFFDDKNKQDILEDVCLKVL